jgi:hypothetical protein
MKCKFIVGQKVVCIDDSELDDHCIITGQIYEIAWIGPYDPFRIAPINKYSGAEILVRISGIPRIYGGYDWPLAAERFKPLEENKKKASTDTGMGILREILDRETYTPSKKAKRVKS